jgi:hypothetical protein
MDSYTWGLYLTILWDDMGEELKDKIHLKKVTPPANCQPLQCNSLRLIINDSHSLTTEPSVLRHYGVGANLIGNIDPIGSFLLELLKEPATTTPSNALSPTLSHSSIIIRLGQL